MNQINKEFLNKRIKKVVIFVVVSILAAQCLVFIQSYAVNLPSGDEWNLVPLVVSANNNDAFWEHENFWEYYDQRIIFPMLVMVANVHLSSWNIIYESYFSWILISISIYFIYLILKQTDEKLTWLVIPASALLFNPAQYESLLWGFASNIWFLALCGIIVSIYFINKAQTSYIYFFLAITFAVIASFSAITGLLIWIVGLLAILPKNGLKKLQILIWSISSIIVFTSYFIDYRIVSGGEDLFTRGVGFDFFKFLMQFLTNGLVPPFHSLSNIQILFGILMIMLIIGIPLYLKLRSQYVQKTLPFLQFGLIGIFSGLIVAFTRVGISDPFTPHYIAMATFAQFSAMAMLTLIFIHFYFHGTQKQKRIVLVLFIISFMVIGISLSLTHFGGWINGKLWEKSKLLILDCIMKPNSDFLCPGDSPDVLEMQRLNFILKENNLAHFSSGNLRIPTEDPLLVYENWESMLEEKNGIGGIKYVIAPGPAINDDSKIIVNKTKIFIPIVGWGYMKEGHVDSSYVFIDSKINSKLDYGYWHEPNFNELSEKYYLSGWIGFIDLRELSLDCHDISIRLVSMERYYIIPLHPKICLE